MSIYYTASSWAGASPNAATELIFSGMAVFHHVINIFKAEIPTPNSRRDSSIGVQCREGAHNAVLGRAHDMADLL